MLAAAASGCADAGRDATGVAEVPLERMQEDLRIGHVDGERPDGFGRIAGLAVDPSDRIYVVDMHAHAVRVFGDDGSYLFTAGREGSGPGELSQPCCPGIAPDGRLWVRDNGNGRYVAFEVVEDVARGVATRRMNHNDVNRFVRTTFDAEGQPIDIGFRPDPATGEPQTVLFHLGDDGGVERVVPAPLPSDPEGLSHTVSLGEGVTRYFHQPFGPRHVVAYGPGGAHADAVTDRYEVRWHSPDGELLRTITDPEAIGPSLTREQRAAADSMIMADERRAGESMPFGSPGRHPVIAALHFDDRGYLWVERTSLPDEPTIADVYDTEGALARRAEIPAGVRLANGVLLGDQVLGVAADALGLQYVIRLR